MHHRLRTINLTVAALLLSVTSGVLLLDCLTPLSVQAQIVQEGNPETAPSFQIGIEQFNQGQLQQALATFEQVLAQSQDSGDKLREAEALSGIGEVYIFGLYPRTEALDVLQEALAIYQVLEDSPQTQFRRKQGKARTLALTGLAYFGLNQNDEVLKNLQQALTIQREIGDKEGEGKTLNHLADFYINNSTSTDQNRLKEALELLQQALAINREVGNSSNETVSLLLMGWGHNSLGDNEQALTLLNEALVKSRENGYRLWEGQTLVLMSLVHNTQGNTEQALLSAQQALPLLEAVGSPWISDALFLMGANYQKQQQYSEALESYQQALNVYRQIDNRTSEGNTLNRIGIVYHNQQDYESALSYYQQALAIHREVENHSVEIATLNNIGIVYQNQKQYAKAREYHEQALSVAKRTDNPTAQVNSLLNINNTYSSQGYEWLRASSIQQALEAFQQALEYSQSALTIAQTFPNSELKNTVLLRVALAYSSIGHAYNAQKQYSEAITAARQALDFARQAGDRQTELNALQMLGSRHLGLAREFIAAEEFQQASVMLQQGLEYEQQALTLSQNDEKKRQSLTGLSNIYEGMRQLYDAQEDYPEAIEASQQILAITRQLGNRSQEALTLGVIASYYSQLSQYRQALELQQQALAIAREIDDPYGEELLLKSIGKTYSDLGQYSQAREHYQQALAIALQQGLLIEQASIPNNLGTIDLAQGEYNRALAHFQQALQMARELRRRIPTEVPDTLAQLCSSSSRGNQTSNSPAYLKDQVIENVRNNCLERTRNLEATILNNIGLVYDNQGRYPEALENYQQSLTITKELKDRGREATVLLNIGAVYASQGEYAKGLEFYQQALEIQTAIGNRYGEMSALNNIGFIYSSWGRYAQALDSYQQSLAIAIEIGTPNEEATILDNIGGVYSAQGNYRQSLEYHQQALTIRREIGDRSGELTSLNNIGTIHVSQGRYPEALEFYQQSLAIATEIGERSAEATILNNIGIVYSDQGNVSQALEYYRQALAIRREIGDRSGELISLNNIGSIHTSQGRYPEALEFYQQSLAIATEISERSEEATILSNIGLVYDMQGDVSQSREFYQQALFIRQEIGDRSSEANSLQNIGMSYYYHGEYAKALESFEQALTITTEIGARRTEAEHLNNLGALYSQLGQYPQAMEYRQQALATAREIGHRTQEMRILNGIGNTYERQERYTEALEPYQQALTIAREIGDRASEGNILTNIGNLYERQGEHSQALASLQQALAIFQEIGFPDGEGRALRGLGRVYAALNQGDRALQSYQQAITIQRELGYRPDASQTFSDLGKLLAQQNQPELAIVFLKQSVNLTETIRQDIQNLPIEQQQSYTETVADTYRRLADLLLQQDRILEAQAVLDLLKVQELDDYLNNVRGNENTEQGVPTLPPEQQIADSYQAILDRAVALGKELTQLRDKNNPTPQDEQRIAQLVKAQAQIIADFDNFIYSKEVLALVDQLSPRTRTADLVNELDRLLGIQDNLRDLQQNAVLFYPLILDDRIELILSTPDSPPIRRTVPVTKAQLNQTLVAFRQALQNPRADAKTPAQQLYNWLIKPLENDLTTAEAETIIYAPDGQLRYIPLAALHDGERWLVQRYRINNITAASLTDLNSQPQPQIQILAGAFASGTHSVEVAGQRFEFGGLPYAGVEVETLAETIPGTTKLLDTAFNPDETIPKMGNHTVVHFATHGKFVVGTPQESFILFGDGTPLTVTEMRQWNLNGVDLVVLSACETGIDYELGTGAEILGLGYQLERAGARAAIASLWMVDDGGTQALMNAFYATLQNNGTTKANALQQAQIALIEGDEAALGGERGVAIVQSRFGEDSSDAALNRLSHPYYWAPFILIGNGL